MPPFPVVEDLQEFKQGSPGLFTGMRDGSMNAFVFDRAKKGLGDGMIVTVPPSAHAHRDLDLFEHLAIGPAGLLASTIRVVEQVSLRFPPSQGHA